MAIGVTTTLTIMDEMDSDNGVGILDTDFFYTGTGCIGIDVDIETWILDNTITVPPTAVDFSGHFHIYAAMLCMTQPTLDLEANGGMGIGIIDSAGDYSIWFVGGKDTYNGGWDVRSAYTGNTPDLQSATAPTLTDIRGIVTYWKCLAKSKLTANCFMDRTAYGNEAALTITGTNTTADLGWSEVLSVADATDATRGYLKSQIGSFIAKGPVVIGDNVGTLTTDFSDDSNILVMPNQPVNTTHNAITGVGNGTGTTDISLTNQVIKSAGERFAFDMSAANLTSLVLSGSTLANVGAITFKSGQTVSSNVFNDVSSSSISNTPANCTFKLNGLITLETGGTLDTCIVADSTSTASVLTDDLADAGVGPFTSDGSNHAVELNSIGGGAMTWSASTSGYDVGSTGSPVTPTSTGNEDIYVNEVTASDLTISVAAGATTPSIRVGASFTGSVNVVAGAITLKMIVKDQAGAFVTGAFAYIDNDNITPFILNSTTDVNGEASVSYSDGAVAGTTWRVRKYGYRPFIQVVDVAGIDITLPVTLITDPQQT